MKIIINIILGKFLIKLISYSQKASILLEASFMAIYSREILFGIFTWCLHEFSLSDYLSAPLEIIQASYNGYCLSLSPSSTIY